MFDLVVFISGLAISAAAVSFAVYFYDEFKFKERKELKEKVKKNDKRIENSNLGDLVNSVNERNKRINEQISED